MSNGSASAPGTNPPRVVAYLRDYFRGFSVLRETRLEYWGVQAVNLLDMSAYFALTNIIIVMLSEKWGFSDVWAGYVWTIFSAVVSLTMFFMGAVTDRLGIRRSLLVSMFGNALGRAGLIVAGLVSEETLRPYTSKLGFDALLAGLASAWSWWHTTFTPHAEFVPLTLTHGATLAFISLLVLAPFLGMSTTSYQAANRRFTTGRSRGAGFNLWYLIMNIGAFAGGAVLDIVRLFLRWDTIHIISFGLVCSVLGFVLIFPLIRTEEQLVGADEKPEPARDPAARKTGVWHALGQVLMHAVFWRFVVLVALIVPVRAIFIYLHALYPKYWLRVIGPDAYIGFLQGFNPVLVIGGLILLIPIVKRYSVFGMLTVGALISTASLFALAVPAWGTAAYVTSLASLLVLTVGEVVWSPRLNEYTAAIAPRGQEGIYYGLSVLPWFIAKTVTSMLSGHMLKWYIPETTPLLRDRLAAGQIPYWQSPAALFLILGGVTLVGPVLAILARKWFTKGARWDQGAT
jgi:MFS family permease